MKPMTLAAAFLAGMTTFASADVVDPTWNMCCVSGTNTALGAVGVTQNFTADGITITAAGFANSAALAANTPNAGLFGKNNGGDEFGLGLTAFGIDGDHEIAGAGVVRIAMAPGLTDVSMTMESVQAASNDSWAISGSNSPTGPFTLLATGQSAGVAIHLPTEAFYTVSAPTGDVLLGTVSAVPVPGPIVGAGLPGLVAACGGLLVLARRRRQRLA